MLRRYGYHLISIVLLLKMVMHNDIHTFLKIADGIHLDLKVGGGACFCFLFLLCNLSANLEEATRTDGL